MAKITKPAAKKALRKPPVREGERNLETVQEFFSLTEGLDIGRAMEFFTDDAVYHNVPLPPAKGKRAVEATLRGMMKYVTAFEVEMVHIAAGGNAVLTERIDTITMGPFKVALPVMGTFELRDGKISAWRDYFDILMMLRFMIPGMGESAAASFRALLGSAK